MSEGNKQKNLINDSWVIISSNFFFYENFRFNFVNELLTVFGQSQSVYIYHNHKQGFNFRFSFVNELLVLANHRVIRYISIINC